MTAGDFRWTEEQRNEEALTRLEAAVDELKATVLALLHRPTSDATSG